MRYQSLAIITAVAAVGLGSTAFGAVNFYNVKQISLTASELDLIGEGANQLAGKPSSIAWDGSTLYVGGDSTNGRIAKITNALTTPTTVGVFGEETGSSTSGYTGLDLAGNTLIGVTTNGGTNAVRVFNTATVGVPTLTYQALENNTTNFNPARSRLDGAAIDPGHVAGATAGGVAVVERGNGRRMLIDSTTGAQIYGASTAATEGFIWSVSDSTARDIDFDPDTGDVYVRVESGVTRGNRTGDNSIVKPSNSLSAGSDQIITLTANVAANNNVTFISDYTGEGDLLIINDKSGTLGTTNPFLSVVKVFDTAGVAESVGWFNFNGTLPFTGVTGTTSQTGIFDFAWDEATQTLAVADYANNQVYIFSTVPEPASLGLIAVGAAGLLRRRRNA